MHKRDKKRPPCLRVQTQGPSENENHLHVSTPIQVLQGGSYGRKSKSRDERRRQRRAALECAAFFGCIALACGLESWIG